MSTLSGGPFIDKGDLRPSKPAACRRYLRDAAGKLSGIHLAKENIT